MKKANTIGVAVLCVTCVALSVFSSAGAGTQSEDGQLSCSVEVRRTSQIFEPFGRPDIKLEYNVKSDCSSGLINIRCWRLQAERGAVWMIDCNNPFENTAFTRKESLNYVHLLKAGIISGIRVLRLTDPYVLGEQFSVRFNISDFGLREEIAESVAKQMKRLDGVPLWDTEPRLQSMILKAMKENSAVRNIIKEFRKVGLTVQVLSDDPVRLTPVEPERTWKDSALLPYAGLPERLSISIKVFAEREGWRKFDSLQNPCGYNITEVSESLRDFRYTGAGKK